MKLKCVDTLEGGEILAEPLLSNKKDIIIPSGAVIKKEYIPLIVSMGIQTIMVEDPFEKYETPHCIIDQIRFDNYVSRTKRIMEGHIHNSNKSLREFETIANEIVKDIQEVPDNIIIDFNERVTDVYEHIVIVTLLSVLIAKRLHLEKTRLFNIALGALLHDIGIRYITVPYEDIGIEEMNPVAVFELKKHTILGYSALDGENWIPNISRKMILSHHERLDGTGYPMRQKNKEIECKIIQVCDAFDCFISGMECRRQSLQKTIAILKEESNSFDRKIVQMLLDIIAPYPVGTLVVTNENEYGVVISQTFEKEKPVIMITNQEDDEEKYKKYNLVKEKDIFILRIM